MKKEKSIEIAEHFKALGFTQLESDIYCYLLGSGLSTGYSIAKGINKPAANVYKALDSLSQKGGVVSSVGSSKSFDAVHWKELLDRQKEQFDQHIESLGEKLKLVNKREVDEQVYQMANREQVIQNSLNVIKNAEKIILADIEPDAMSVFSTVLIDAAKRGVEVRVKVYVPVTLPGVHVTLRDHAADIHEKSKDISFSICADGFEFVTAMLSQDTLSIIQAFRSHSALMNMIIHNYILYGQVLTDLKKQIKNNDFTQAKMTLENTEHLHPLSTENIVFQHFKNRYAI
jgi:sugar-specific transcriptional regulator TrmB